MAPRRADHESSLSRYNNPDYGISFRYPRNYVLEEGNILEHSYFLKRQEEVDLEQSGAKLIATVLIPEDSYPNTTFLHGSLQLIVDNTTSEASCFETAMPDSADARPIRTLAPEGLQFIGSEKTSAAADTQILERDYAAFRNGICYEFYVVIAVSEPDSSDSTLQKPPDSPKIIGQLEKIVLSLILDREESAREGFKKAETAARLESQPRFIPVWH